jgi:hypothetical protein
MTKSQQEIRQEVEAEVQKQMERDDLSTQKHLRWVRQQNRINRNHGRRGGKGKGK